MIKQDISVNINHPLDRSDKFVCNVKYFEKHLYILYMDCISMYSIKLNEHQRIIELPEKIIKNSGLPVLIISKDYIGVAQSCFPNCQLFLWETESDKCEDILLPTCVGGQLNYELCGFINRSILYLGTNNSAQVWDIEKKESILNKKPSSNAETFVSFSFHNYKLNIHSFYNIYIYLKHGKDINEICSKSFKEHKRYVTLVKPHFSGYIIVGTHDGSIYILDDKGDTIQGLSAEGPISMNINDNSEYYSLDIPFDKKINCIHWNEDINDMKDHLIFVGHQDNLISVWSYNNLEKFSLLKTIRTNGPVANIEHKDRLYAQIYVENTICLLEIEVNIS